MQFIVHAPDVKLNPRENISIRADNKENKERQIDQQKVVTTLAAERLKIVEIITKKCMDRYAWHGIFVCSSLHIIIIKNVDLTSCNVHNSLTLI